MSSKPFFKFFLLLKFWASGFCWPTLYWMLNQNFLEMDNAPEKEQLMLNFTMVVQISSANIANIAKAA